MLVQKRLLQVRERLQEASRQQVLALVRELQFYRKQPEQQRQQ
jgi:hypothetical protein